MTEPKDTREGKIKKFAVDLWVRYVNLGLTHQKAQDAALICILAMIDQYLNITKDGPEERAKKKNDFDLLIKGLNDYCKGRNFVEVPIQEIAEFKGCKKDQILITY